HRIETADLVLELAAADAEGPTPPIHPGALSVRTKGDLAPTSTGEDALTVSALTGAGLDRLLDAIGERAAAALGGGDALVTRERHRDALTRCATHLDRMLSAPAGQPELVAEDLRLAVRALGEIGGHVGVDEMLDRLFAGFCIGK
ncbi:MAG TPA: tRNA uridine-5-carboxymethylaminomethyl(34) synthesis GTPase MnmE, partial [Methylobacterium sp.]